MKHNISYLLILICFPTSLLGADFASNVRVQQYGTDIHITYDLSKTANVRLLVSIDKKSFVPLKAVNGAVGKHVNKGSNLTIEWHPLDEYENLISDNVRFKVETISAYEAYSSPYNKNGYHERTETFILGEVAYSIPLKQMSYGGMFGQTYRQGVGWYIDIRSNYIYAAATKDPATGKGLTCAEGGYIDGVLPFYTGNKQYSIVTAHAGLMFDFLDAAWAQNNRFNMFGLYFGAGYGWRRMLWETVDGRWVEYSPTSNKGLSANIGLLFGFYHLSFRVGASSIVNMQNVLSSYWELEGGVGFAF